MIRKPNLIIIRAAGFGLRSIYGMRDSQNNQMNEIMALSENWGRDYGIEALGEPLTKCLRSQVNQGRLQPKQGLQYSVSSITTAPQMIFLLLYQENENVMCCTLFYDAPLDQL